MLLPVEPQLAGNRPGFGGSRQPDNRVGTLFGAAQQAACGAVESRQCGLYSRGVSPARVHGVDRDTLLPPTLGPLLGQDHEAALRTRIGDRTGVAAFLVLQVAHVYFLRIHTAGQHIDDARRFSPGQQRLQSFRQY